MSRLRNDATEIFTNAIRVVLPQDSVRRVLGGISFEGPVTAISIGKAAWTMASAAAEVLGSSLARGIVLTKYGHAQGPIPGIEILEAGHPLPDEGSIRGTRRILEVVESLREGDRIVLLLSGGGSALFELPAPGIELEDIADLTEQLLSCGADIVEINTIRKRLSAVKGGRFAQRCGNRQITAVVLSDVLGNRLDSIASGPVSPDVSTVADALEIVGKYQLSLRDEVLAALAQETPKVVSNCEAIIAGSVEALCEAAAVEADKLGYAPLVLTTSLQCEARAAGSLMASLAAEARRSGNRKYGVDRPCAIIAGGETVVRLAGTGKGGRNQELALAAALEIRGLDDVVVVAVGSDGTDGPTDAAGGIVDGESADRIAATGTKPEVYLDNNDSYHALAAVGDLIQTGPTGTNVNDLMFVLCR